MHIFVIDRKIGGRPNVIPLFFLADSIQHTQKKNNNHLSVYESVILCHHQHIHKPFNFTLGLVFSHSSLMYLPIFRPSLYLQNVCTMITSCLNSFVCSFVRLFRTVFVCVCHGCFSLSLVLFGGQTKANSFVQKCAAYTSNNIKKRRLNINLTSQTVENGKLCIEPSILQAESVEQLLKVFAYICKLNTAIVA